MAKFYVQSGSFRTVVAAQSASKAALWGVHQVMQQVLPLETHPEPTASDDPKNVSRCGGERETPVAVLSARIRVDERGFDRHDATEMPTMEVVGQWNQMVTTLDRLERMLYQA
ncbi:MAG: hypothetical protein AAGD07_23350 [Planctomycetota bacterium]